MADIRNSEIARAYETFAQVLHDTRHSPADYVQALEEVIVELQMDLDAAPVGE